MKSKIAKLSVLLAMHAFPLCAEEGTVIYNQEIGSEALIPEDVEEESSCYVPDRDKNFDEDAREGFWPSKDTHTDNFLEEINRDASIQQR